MSDGIMHHPPQTTAGRIEWMQEKCNSFTLNMIKGKNLIMAQCAGNASGKQFKTADLDQVVEEVFKNCWMAWKPPAGESKAVKLVLNFQKGKTP